MHMLEAARGGRGFVGAVEILVNRCSSIVRGVFQVN